MGLLPEEEQRRLLAACFERSELTLESLWIRYFTLGGAFSLLDLDAYLNGLTSLPAVDRDMIAHAVNERLDELAGPPRAPYSRPVGGTRPLHGPLAALVNLLEGAHKAPPERLPSIVASAGRALDVDIRVYLADYDQRLLIPLPSRDAGGRCALEIDNTVAGAVWRQVDTVVTRDGPVPTLWTVLLDGVERLGVLEVTPTDGADPDDPLLRNQCRWLSMLLGHLVTITTQYGDGLDVVRRRRHRASPAELLWDSLPPLTAATDAVVVGASVQPAYNLCGTVFDYSLSEDRAYLAMFDARTHTEEASLAVVNVLAEYRAARRDGAGLEGQYAACGRALSGHLPVTGVLVELDLREGSVRYLNAGHPAPLLVRDGKVIRWLEEQAGPRFGTGEPTAAIEQLHPADVLVLHSHGVLDAADRSGGLFGQDRLVDRLEHFAAMTPPEAARQLTSAVTAHCGGELRHDAEFLVTRWLNDNRRPAPHQSKSE